MCLAFLIKQNPVTHNSQNLLALGGSISLRNSHNDIIFQNMKCIYCGIHKQNCCVSTSRSKWPPALYLTYACVRIVPQYRATYLLPAGCSQWILLFQILYRCDCQIHAEQDTKLFFTYNNRWHCPFGGFGTDHWQHLVAFSELW